MSTGAQVQEVSRLLKVLELVRSKVHRELPLQQLVLFLTVAENPGITMPELVDLLGMPQGTVSRNVKALAHSVVWQDGVAIPYGRNLLRTAPAESNRHVLSVFATGRGEALCAEIERELKPDAVAGRSEVCGRVDYVDQQWRDRFLMRQMSRDF